MVDRLRRRSAPGLGEVTDDDDTYALLTEPGPSSRRKFDAPTP